MNDGRMRVVYRASGLGGCENALAMLRDGMTPAPPPAFMLEKYQQGHNLEPVILDMLRDGTVAKQDAAGNQYAVTVAEGLEQYEANVVVADTATQLTVVRGHIDGGGTVARIGPSGILTSTECRIEIKALGKDYYAKFKKHGHKGLMYDWQLSTYMIDGGRDDSGALTNPMPILMVCGLKNSASTDKVTGEVIPAGTRIDELLVEWIDTPPKSLGVIKAKVLMIESGRVDKCKTRHYPCGFYWMDGTACSGDKGAETEAKEEAAGEAAEEAAAQLTDDDRDFYREQIAAWGAAKDQELAAKKVYDDAVAVRKAIEAEIGQRLEVTDAAVQLTLGEEEEGASTGPWRIEWIKGEVRAGYAVERSIRSYVKITPPPKPRKSTSKKHDLAVEADPFVGVDAGEGKR